MKKRNWKKIFGFNFGTPLFSRFEVEEEEDLEGEPKPTSGVPSPQDKMIEKLQELNAGAESQRLLLQLQNDPEIRRILEARQSGQKLKIVEEKVEEEKEPEIPETELDELSNSKLVKVLEKQLGKKISSGLGDVVKGMLDEALKPVVAELRAVSRYANDQAMSQGQKEIETLSEKYQDFQDLRPKLAALSKDNPGLSMEELYSVQKKRMNQPVMERQKVASERPGGMSPRDPVRLKPSETKDLSPNRVMQLLLEKATARSVNLDDFPDER